MTTENPEVTRCRVATVKLSRRRGTWRNDRGSLFSVPCVYSNTQGSCWESATVPLPLRTRETNKRKAQPKQDGARAHMRTGRQTHPKQQRGQPKTQRPEDKEKFGVFAFPHFHPRHRHPPGGADAQNRRPPGPTTVSVLFSQSPPL